MPENAVQVATGKRKCAIARIRLIPGPGSVTVNKRGLADYFGRPTLQMIVEQALVLTGTKGRYDVLANVHGGGIAAHAEAIRHGVTRALIEANPNHRPALKKAGYITRDPRKVERKKYGRHKARKRPQYSKR